MTRDKTIDGYRAIAALGVVFAHAADFRFVRSAPHLAQRLADPLSQTSVQLFFVISGFIITSLLLRERAETGRVSIPSFYIRRACRILPPLAAVLVTVALLELVDPQSLAMASTFTCNIGDCRWAVAHTWSLSVEEQFYLVWPIVLVVLDPPPSLLIAAIGADLVAFLIAPLHWHSNYISFACIGTGALYAMSQLRLRISSIWWLVAGTSVVLAPIFLPPKLIQCAAPFLIAYLLFATPPWAKRLLAARPIQIVGLSSYSVYLWQQLFLGTNSLSLWALPLAVFASVVLIERPFIRLGHRLSSLVSRRQSSKVVTAQ